MPMTQPFRLFGLLKSRFNKKLNHHNEWIYASIRLTTPLTRSYIKVAMSKAYLNVGRGTHYHAEWGNINVNPSASDVMQFDIANGLPFNKNEFDVVYSSHMLEHLSQSDGIRFLKEMYRVLKPDGVIRIVVPDLEGICRVYLGKLAEIRAGNESAVYDYEWMRLELLDQIARESGGGEMLRFLLNPSIPNKDFVVSRIGQEARNIWKQDPGKAPIGTARPNDKISCWIEKLKSGIVTALFGKEAAQAIRIGRFRLSGENHKFMYDEYSCRNALSQAGFINAVQKSASDSAIMNFASYGLDVLPDGEVRKPNSIFIEASKAGIVNKERPINIYHCCIQKSASQWVSRVLHDCIDVTNSDFHHEYPNMDFIYTKQNRSILMNGFTSNSIVSPLYVTYDDFCNMPKPSRYRGFWVMRDIRDIMVSQFFSIAYSHNVINDNMEKGRQLLQNMDFGQAFTYFITNVYNIKDSDFPYAAALLSWAKCDDPNIMLCRYEDLTGENSYEEWCRLFVHLGFDISSNNVKSILDRRSFTQMTGRKRGVEDHGSHMRKGMSGDWRNYFNEEHISLFKTYLSKVLIDSGYEYDEQWSVKNSLPI